MISRFARPLGVRALTPRLVALVLCISGSVLAAEEAASPSAGASTTAATSPASAAPSSSPSTGGAPPPKSATPSPGAPAAEGVTERRDPAGVSGLSPFAEALIRGDAAYLARNFSGAEQEYRAAIQISPQDARGHLRLAAATFALGRPDDAIASAEAALRFAGPDARLRSDALRFMALVIEQTGALDRAVEAWNKFALGDAKVPRRVAPPEDIASAHIARIEARQAALTLGNRIRERIARELAGEPPLPVSKETPGTPSRAAAPSATPAAN